ncbi:Regulator of sirC expression, contains transglutaminase-like and TPR domains [Izhakiella capsodis]|uniref:Regulator of sirC expression, contains transglutaminase-like and TPR domains n=1 Tax=Izhakiella capsodis TaxID=1367852 RepID=A0A1I4UYG0_9GAMM|nr:invasion regulator SirB1 [Izhakiella capsodis]SFM93948.1 Regulator of sirC expression, contains transglutaminase-like and TPR domains [Izhakiella capsodis]
MTSLTEFDFHGAPLSEAAIVALQAIRQDFPAERVRAQLKALVAEARETIPASLEQDMQVDQLLKLFYQRWGFGGASGVYRLSDVLWLDNVLHTRQGSAVSLGIVLLHIAHELKLPLMPVIFPTQLILRADWLDGEMWLINPFDGETLDEHTLDVWLKGNIGPVEELFEDDLEEAEPVVVIRKMLDTLKSALMEEKQMELALQASQALVQMDPEDPYEIRDRGLIFAQLECEHIALTDLTYFVEQCPEDPISELIKVQINAIEHKQITLH